jgi:hypothetical protein
MWRLGVPKKYVMNIPISGFLAAITIKVLGRFVPEAYAFGVGVFVLGKGLPPSASLSSEEKGLTDRQTV